MKVFLWSPFLKYTWSRVDTAIYVGESTNCEKLANKRDSINSASSLASSKCSINIKITSNYIWSLSFYHVLSKLMNNVNGWLLGLYNITNFNDILEYELSEILS